MHREVFARATNDQRNHQGDPYPAPGNVIVASEDLHRLAGEVTMVSGGFDPLHDGHADYFAAAREVGLPVLCNVTGDAYVSRKHPPLLPQDRRARLLDVICHLDYTHVSDLATHEVLSLLRPRYFAKGRDWEGKLPAEEVAVCEEAQAEIVYLDTILDSSTRLLDVCVERYARTKATG